MRTIYDPNLKATITLDDSGQVRGIKHIDKYREVEHLGGREAATAYIRNIAEKLNIAPEALRSLDQPVSYFDTQPHDRQITARLIRGRFFIYRYDPDKRTEAHPEPTPSIYVPEQGATQPIDRPLSSPPPTLPLQPVPKSIQTGHWYLVAELIVRLTSERQSANWRMLAEVRTGP